MQMSQGRVGIRAEISSSTHMKAASKLTVATQFNKDALIQAANDARERGGEEREKGKERREKKEWKERES